MKRNSTKDEQIIAALLTYPTRKAAADACGMGESQLYVRLRDAEFKAKYDEARKQLLSQATDALTGHIMGAVDTMAEVMVGDSASPQVKLNAAEAIIRNAVKLAETMELRERIEALEELLDNEHIR